MKLSELKDNVYKQADVSTTAQLKQKYESVRALDMRYKASWEQALVIVQSIDAPDTNEFEAWLHNPPDEYKDLFAEIHQTEASYAEKLAQAKQLNANILSIADSLDNLAEESREQAKQLERELETAQQTKRQAELN